MQDKRFCFCRVFQRIFFPSMVKNVIVLSARSSVRSAWHRLVPLCCSEFCISNPALILLCLRGFSCAHENNFCPHFSTTFLGKRRNSRQLHEIKSNPTDQTHNPNLWFFFNFFPPFCILLEVFFLLRGGRWGLQKGGRLGAVLWQDLCHLHPLERGNNVTCVPCKCCLCSPLEQALD